MELRGVLDFNSKHKTEKWATDINQLIIQNAQFFISQSQYDYLKSYSTGVYDTTDYMYNFYDKETILKNHPEQIRIDFQPIDLLSVYRHVITSSIDKQPINPDATCTDETAISKLEEDIAKKRLYKEQIEPFLKLTTKALGGNPKLVTDPNTEYNSNMDEADSLGLDMSNPLDKAIWKDSLQRPKWESSLEIGIDHFFKLSDIKELRKKWVHDYFDCNVMASQVVQNSASGLPESLYLKPYSVYTVNATRPDKSNAIGIGYNQTMSIKQFLEIFVKEVKDEDELQDILMAANIQTGMTYVGIWWGQGEQPANTCTWSEFLGMSLTVGYIEWKTQNIDKYEDVDEYGTKITYKRPADYEPKKKGSKIEQRFYESIYKWYFLQDNPVKVYGFGLLPNQVRKGTFNELSDFSIQIYVEEGQSITERSIPYIKRFFDAWTKWQYFLLEAKPSGMGYDVDAVYKIMQDIKAPDGSALDPISYVKFLKSSIDFLYKSARDESGNPLGGDGTPFKKVERGVDPSMMELVNAMELQVRFIRTITGISEVRTAADQQGEGYKVSVFNLQRSQDTTYYIESGLYHLISQQGGCVAYHIQEIIYDKDFAYESLVEAIGQYNVDCIASLNNNSPKAFSIFIGISMTDLQRIEIQQDAALLAQTGVITLGQKYMVERAGSYKLAKQLLSYFEAKTKENKQKEALALQQGAAQLEMMKQKGDMEKINAKGQWDYKTSTDTAKINQGASIQSEKIKSDTKQKLQSEKLYSSKESSLQSHLQSKDMAYAEADIENNSMKAQQPQE